jgi:tetraprenyl-beta-curcumene synthase
MAVRAPLQLVSDSHSRPTPRISEDAADLAPLSARQLYVLASVAAQELIWALPTARREVHRWRARARTIPDTTIREDALNAITDQRGHIDGACLFSILPHRRDRHLLRLLATYEIIWDFLDNLNERSASIGLANGLQLHRALVDALRPGTPTSNYYEHSPHNCDGHYLNSLVKACCSHLASLPSHDRLRDATVREALRIQVCAINHDPDSWRRDATLAEWANREFPTEPEVTWFELAAAASTNLTIFALLALASERTCTRQEIDNVASAYFPWLSTLTAMLDSYVDQAEDAHVAHHSYIAHYDARGRAQRISELIHRYLGETRSLRQREKHIVIAACMFALFLSKDSALNATTRQTTDTFLHAGGSVTRLLHPILRLWRAAHGLHSA